MNWKRMAIQLAAAATTAMAPLRLINGQSCECELMPPIGASCCGSIPAAAPFRALTGTGTLQTAVRDPFTGLPAPGAHRFRLNEPAPVTLSAPDIAAAPRPDSDLSGATVKTNSGSSAIGSVPGPASGSGAPPTPGGGGSGSIPSNSPQSPRSAGGQSPSSGISGGGGTSSRMPDTPQNPPPLNPGPPDPSEEPDDVPPVIRPPETIPDPVPPVPEEDPEQPVGPVPDNRNPEETPVVPEPGSLLLMLTGGAIGSIYWLRRNNRSRAQRGQGRSEAPSDGEPAAWDRSR